VPSVLPVIALQKTNFGGNFRPLVTIQGKGGRVALRTTEEEGFSTMDDLARDSMKKVFGDPGTPVSTVDVDDLKAVWKIGREVQSRHEGKHVAVGFGIYECACAAGADVKSVRYRASMLAMVVSHGGDLLAGFLNNEAEPADAVFNAIAKVPMRWMEVGVQRQGPPFDLEEFRQLLHGGRA